MIKRNPDSEKDSRPNSWNRYKALNQFYEGIFTGQDSDEETCQIDLEHEYGLTLLDIDSSDEESKDGDLTPVNIYTF